MILIFIGVELNFPINHISFFIILQCFYLFVSDTICIWKEGPSWSWSYDSWIYNYLCKQCLSPLKLWVRTSFMARCTLQLYVIKFVCDLRQVSGFLQVLHVSSTNKTKCHSIAEIFFESGIKQHIPILEKLVSNRCMLVSPLCKMCTRYKIMW